MKRLLATLFALASLTTLSIAADFQGRLEMTTTVNKRSTPITYYIKSGHLRFESQPEKNVTSVGLLDGATGTITVLMVEQKMYMQFSAPKATSLPPEITFTETGRTEVIAGKTCSEFIVKDKKNTTEIWATSELGGMANLGESFGRRGKRTPWEEEMLKRGMFALRVITKNAKGAETMRLECTKIVEEKLDDSLFKIPEGYTKMPGLGDLFGR